MLPPNRCYGFNATKRQLVFKRRGRALPRRSVYRLARSPFQASLTPDDTSSPARAAPAEAGVRGKKILQDRVRKHAELDRVWSFLVARHDGLERVEAKILREVQQRALQLLQGVQREMAQRVVAAAAARADDGWRGDGWRGNGNGAGAVGHR